MPEGVEHSTTATAGALAIAVIIPEMPEGVEHWCHCWRSFDSARDYS